MLSTIAHAVAGINDGVLTRSRFTLIDRCPTPLTLCAEFATSQSIALRTICAEILDCPEDVKADIVILHSLLRFMGHDQQVRILKLLAQRLEPEGRIILSQSLRSGSEAETNDELRKHAYANRIISKLQAQGDFVPLEPSDLFQLRLRRSHQADRNRMGEMQSMDEALQLFADSQLKVDCVFESEHQIALESQSAIKRRRVLAVLKKHF